MAQRVPILNLRAQYKQVGETIEQSVLDVLRSGNYILGEHVHELEKDVAALCGVKHGVGVANGTDALILSLWCLDIGPGDEVITTPFTFAATVEAIALRGAKPVFVDIEPTSFNMDPRLLEKAITKKTKAIMPVHLYGLPSDMEPIVKIAKKAKVRIIEDNAQGIGATYRGMPTGSFGDVACISFYPTKNLGACGDAGMLVTDDEKIAQRLRTLRAHGSQRRYFHDELGVNSRLDEIQAVALRAKLPFLKEWNKRRDGIARLYSSALQGCPGITVPAVTATGQALSPQQLTHVWHQYTIRVHSNAKDRSADNKEREMLTKALSDRGIGSMCYYPVPLHLQKAFSNLGYKQGKFPESERAANEVLSLPMYPELTSDDVLYVATAIKEIMGQSSTVVPVTTVAPTFTGA
ncbi:MAG: DegT/DnrJ/EryC1/StrS family aminotransferase [Candidatus Obscuribacterales bacterium]|nr:DegT/DnrJ/EryC1/StrS family aminotransferase [Candidatus Obscuribacterales bacterium]